METLPEEFNKAGYDHKQLKRTGNKAIFSRRDPETGKTHYEVVIIQAMKDAYFGDRLTSIVIDQSLPVGSLINIGLSAT